MSTVSINYNPYTVKTVIAIDGNEENNQLVYTKDKRLQEWMEPRGQWEGIFKEISKVCNERTVKIDFHGTAFDFADMEYAAEKYGRSVFSEIELCHVNKDTASISEQSNKIEQLKELYKELQNGPIEELKIPKIKNAFENAINSNFEIVVVAPMSSGKSTLINSILGRDLLPAVNKATTAVITKIKDNDNAKDFTVTCNDKYGKPVCKKEKATKELISELNYKKDPSDSEGKEALIKEMSIEGPIKTLPSDKLNTVFVDTPGGNNAQNAEHEKMMDKAIRDENKSLILCVINGQTPTTNDADGILQKISEAMKQSANGKQSRDRFIFVANKFDDVHPEEEPYDDYIKTTILPELEKHGITEPNLFLVSAKTAKLIRMFQDGQKLTENEEDEFDSYIKKFNRDNRRLTDFSSLSQEKKDLFNAEISELKEKDGECAKIRIAEINSGIPAVEEAIKSYLDKYALAIKIKVAHDSFMKKVNDIEMLQTCERNWSASEKERGEVIEELKLKKNKFGETERIKIALEQRIDSIKIDTGTIESKRDEITETIIEIGNTQHKKIKREDAQEKIGAIIQRFEVLFANAQENLNEFNKTAVKSCNEILKEYTGYIKQLDDEGLFDLGGLRLKELSAMPKLNIQSVDEMLSDDTYIKTKQETLIYEKSGFWNWLKRKTGLGGWGSCDVDVEYVDVKKLIQDQVGRIRMEFLTRINDEIKGVKDDVENVKERAKQDLSKIESVIVETHKAIEEKIKDKELLDKSVAENKEKYEWIQSFIAKVAGILEI